MSTPSSTAPLLLVVDDNPLNADPLCDLLESMGYRVSKAPDGPTALALVRERPPDLILLDIMMPGMNGFEVCRRLKADPRSAKIPVVFVTALSDTSDKLEAIEAGGDDFLTKPFNNPILLARIRSLLRLKQASDDLQESYRKLQALERLRDDLMKMIVHDLKSPLAAVLATLEMAVDGDLGPLSAEQQRLLGDAHQRGDDLLHLIDDLLELTQLEDSHITLTLGRIDVGELLREVADEWRVRVEQNDAQLAVETSPDLNICADQHLLRRVFSNLIGNALQHAGESVKIRLVAEPARAHSAKDSGVHFIVEDNGVGIPEVYQELIFRKFGFVNRSERTRFRSSGLGLTLCKLVIEAHGGQIWVHSREREGSAFHFILPPRPPQSPAELPPDLG